MRRLFLAFVLLFCVSALAADNQWLCISDVTFSLTVDPVSKKYSGKSYIEGQNFVVTEGGVRIAESDDVLQVSEGRPMACDIETSEWRDLSDGSTIVSVSGISCAYKDTHPGWGVLSIDFSNSHTLTFEARFPYENGETSTHFGRCTTL